MEYATLHQIEDNLHIECADGVNPPYLGYTQTSVKIPGIEEVEWEVVILVVSNTRFNKAVLQTLGQSYNQQRKES